MLNLKAMTRIYTCRYGLMFFVGVMFGSCVMFYKSFDLSRQTSMAGYMWSQRDSAYVPVREFTSRSTSIQYVMILTYMRSGSSFTGDILQHHPESFYVFEPLYTTHRNRSVIFLNGTTRYFKTDADLIHEGQRQLLAWYNCDLYNVDADSLAHLFMDFSIHTSVYYKCIGKKKTFFDVKRCLPPLVDACKKSKVRVIKTIRMTMLSVKPMLEDYPNLKIIHLIRDPRGVLNSRVITEPKLFPKHNLRLHVKGLCAEMAADMTLTKAIMGVYPTRLMVLQYEELAEHPYKTTAHLYNFLGTPPTLEIYGYVFCITSMGGVAERHYDITRSNSTSTANKWKTSLTRREINIIDNTCTPYYTILGYLPVVSKNSSQIASYKTRINIFK